MSLSSWSHCSPSSPSLSAMLPSPSKRLVKSKSGLKIVSQHERGRAPWSLEEPHWVKDIEVAQCSDCQNKFDLLNRRHHCRRCGRIFCNKCSSSKIQFHRMGFVDPVRVCKGCKDVTEAEKKFFDNELKVLFGGAVFHVVCSQSISGDKFLYNCKLSSDERFLLFDNHGDEGEQIAPVDLCRIKQVQPENREQGQEISPTLTLSIHDPPTDPFELTFDCPEEPSRKPSLAWIDAFQQGIQLVFDSRTSCRDDQHPDTPPAQN